MCRCCWPQARDGEEYLQLFLECCLVISTALMSSGMVASALAGGEAWQEYLQLFLESRFVHVTSV